MLSLCSVIMQQSSQNWKEASPKSQRQQAWVDAGLQRSISGYRSMLVVGLLRNALQHIEMAFFFALLNSLTLFSFHPTIFQQIFWKINFFVSYLFPWDEWDWWKAAEFGNALLDHGSAAHSWKPFHQKRPQFSANTHRKAKLCGQDAALMSQGRVKHRHHLWITVHNLAGQPGDSEVGSLCLSLLSGVKVSSSHACARVDGPGPRSAVNGEAVLRGIGRIAHSLVERTALTLKMRVKTTTGNNFPLQRGWAHACRPGQTSEKSLCPARTTACWGVATKRFAASQKHVWTKYFFLVISLTR